MPVRRFHNWTGRQWQRQRQQQWEFPAQRCCSFKVSNHKMYGHEFWPFTKWHIVVALPHFCVVLNEWGKWSSSKNMIQLHCLLTCCLKCARNIKRNCDPHSATINRMAHLVGPLGKRFSVSICFNVIIKNIIFYKILSVTHLNLTWHKDGKYE